jgi:hypothetical protein
MSELDPACPPIDSASSTSVLNPSDAAYTAAASPAGPAPTITRSTGSRGSDVVSPYAAARAVSSGSRRIRPSGTRTSGTPV